MVSAPIVRPRAIIGTVMTELSWSRSTTSSNSGSVMLAASISSCVISGISSETPVRTTCATPVGLSGSAREPSSQLVCPFDLRGIDVCQRDQ